MAVIAAKARARALARARRTIVAVFGSGRSSDPAAAEVGRLIATLGHDLLTGAGGGVMEAASRAFFETSPRRGLVVGIVPAEVHGLRELEARVPVDVDYELRPGYPNPWVELAIYTHLPDSGPDGTLRSSRNHLNVLTADAIVALPGGEGTASEIWLATQYGVPIVAFGSHRPPAPHGVPHAATIEDVREFLQRTLS